MSISKKKKILKNRQYYLACGEGHVETTKILLGNCSRGSNYHNDDYLFLIESLTSRKY